MDDELRVWVAVLIAGLLPAGCLWLSVALSGSLWFPVPLNGSLWVFGSLLLNCKVDFGSA